MKLFDIITRAPLAPWVEGEKIPWNDPAFSARMLDEHLTQEHDLASRRASIIDQQVAWIHRELLRGTADRILDLGCGPGLYAARLARLGHRCVGIDFSPAAIDHARSVARNEGLDCEFLQQDVRQADFGSNFGLVLFIYGELNVFRPQEAADILRRASDCLRPGGRLLLEPHTAEAVEQLGRNSTSWSAAQSGLFSADPHICLKESAWLAEERTAVERFFIIDAGTGDVTRHAATIQAYSDDEYRDMLRSAGFAEVSRRPSLESAETAREPALFALVATR